MMLVILGVGSNTGKSTKQGELSMDAVKKIRNTENSLEQIGKIVQSRDDMIKGLSIEIQWLRNEVDMNNEDFVLQIQECRIIFHHINEDSFLKY